MTRPHVYTIPPLQTISRVVTICGGGSFGFGLGDADTLESRSTGALIDSYTWTVAFLLMPCPNGTGDFTTR